MPNERGPFVSLASDRGGEDNLPHALSQRVAIFLEGFFCIRAQCSAGEGEARRGVQ